METRDNKYLKWYWNICERAKTREKPVGYTEKHHIYPKSIYGENKDLVSLTAKEHYVVHLCLWQGLRQKYGMNDFKTRKMAWAFSAMSMYNNKTTKQRAEIKNAKEFSFLRIAYSEAQRGVPKTPEQNKRNSESNKGRAFTEEHRNNLKGPKSEDHRENIKRGRIQFHKDNPDIFKGRKNTTLWTEEMRLACGERSKERIKKNGHPRGMLGKKMDPDIVKTLVEKRKIAWLLKTQEEKDTIWAKAYGEYIIENTYCYRCGKVMEIKYRDKTGPKERYFCCKFCARGNHQKFYYDKKGIRHEKI